MLQKQFQTHKYSIHNRFTWIQYLPYANLYYSQCNQFYALIKYLCKFAC